MFTNNLYDTIFGYIDFETVRIADEAEERKLIAAAQSRNSEATERLLLAYSPIIRRGFSTWLKATGKRKDSVDADDARGEYILAFLEAVYEFDLGGKYDRIAGVSSWFLAAASERMAATQATAYSVPKRTLRRFFEVLRLADGNVDEAAGLAPKKGMSTGVFWSILEALRGGNDTDGTEPFDHIASATTTQQTSVDDQLMALAALAAMKEEERQYNRLFHGFDTYNTMSDAEIAEHVGAPKSTVQWKRAAGIHAARVRLGVFAPEAN